MLDLSIRATHLLGVIKKLKLTIVFVLGRAFSSGSDWEKCHCLFSNISAILEQKRNWPHEKLSGVLANRSSMFRCSSLQFSFNVVCVVSNLNSHFGRGLFFLCTPPKKTTSAENNIVSPLFATFFFVSPATCLEGVSFSRKVWEDLAGGGGVPVSWEH